MRSFFNFSLLALGMGFLFSACERDVLLDGGARASNAPTPFDGQWSGSISGGGTIHFVVLEGRVTSLQHQGTCNSTLFSFLNGEPIEAGTVSVTAGSSLASSGTFTSALQVKGVTSVLSGCSGSLPLNWTASK